MTLFAFMFIENFKIKRQKGHSVKLQYPGLTEFSCVWKMPYKAKRFLMAEDNFTGSFHKLAVKIFLAKPTKEAKPHPLPCSDPQPEGRGVLVPSATGLPKRRSLTSFYLLSETTGLPESLDTFLS